MIRPSFSTNTLTQGIHTIFFRVQDDQGAWSKEAVALVIVRDCDSPVAIMPLGNSITYGIGEISEAGFDYWLQTTVISVIEKCRLSF